MSKHTNEAQVEFSLARTEIDMPLESTEHVY